MDLGLVLSIATGIILGGAVLLNGERLLRLGRSLWMAAVASLCAGRARVRSWRKPVAVVIGGLAVATLFVLTRAESTFEQWKVNQRIRAEMKGQCEEVPDYYWHSSVHFYHCSIGQGDDRLDLLFMRDSCDLVRYVGDTEIDSVKIDACLRAK